MYFHSRFSPFVAAAVYLSACASGGGTGFSGADIVAGSVPASTAQIPDTQTSSTPTPSSPTTVPSPSNGTGPTFPIAAALLETTSNGIWPVAGHQDGTATVLASSANTSTIKLVVPSANVDATFTVPGNLTTTSYGWDANNCGCAWTAGLAYVSLGLWQQVSEKPFYGTTVAYVSGNETPTSAIPQTGTATYNGVGTVLGRVFFPDNTGMNVGVIGKTAGSDISGDAALTTDFANGSINGKFFNMKGDLWNIGFDSPWNDVSISASITAGTNGFSGTTGTNGFSGTTAPFSSGDADALLKAGATGIIDGAFYGPNAQNLGAIWTLSDGIGTAIGVVGAGRP